MEENVQIDKDFVDASPKKKKGLIVGIIILAIIFSLLVAFKLLYLDNPYRIIVSNLKEAKTSISNSLNNVKVFNGNSVNVEIETMGLLFDTIGLNDLNKYTLNISSTINSKEKEAKLSLLFKDGRAKKNIDVELTYLDGVVYYNFKDAYKSIIEQKLSDERLKEANSIFDQSSQTDSEKTTYITSKVLTLLAESIDKDSFKKSKTSININNENIKVNDLTYTFDNKLATDTINHVIDGLLNDNTSITYLAVLYQIDTEEVKEMLTSMKEEYDENDATELYIHFYTMGFNNNLVGIKFESNKDANNSMSYYYLNNSFELLIENTFKMNGTLEKGKTIEIYSGKDLNKIVTLNIKEYKDKEFDVDYTIHTSKTGETYSGNIYLLNEVAEASNSSKLTITLDRVIDGLTSTAKVNITSEAKDKYDITLDKTNIVKYDEISSETLIQDLLTYYKDIELFEMLTVLIAQPGEE